MAAFNSVTMAASCSTSLSISEQNDREQRTLAMTDEATETSIPTPTPLDLSSPSHSMSYSPSHTHPPPGCHSRSVPALPCWLMDGQLLEDALKAVVGRCAELLSFAEDEAQQRKGAELLYKTIMDIWSLETGQISRRAADIACDEIRLNGGLNQILHLLCCTKSDTLIIMLAQGLEQVMVSGNRTYIANHSLFQDTVRVVSRKDLPELVQYATGILENLFKESTKTCFCMIEDGGLEGIIHACRYSDPVVLQHCAAALTNCAMYGSTMCQEMMIRSNVDHWLFPLAFSDDNVVKYYALLGISYLAANEQIADRVAQSGTLDLVLPFLHSRDPDQFAKSCPSHAHGRSAGWLGRLKPLLVSDCEEARSMAAFHFAMEAPIKKKQKKLDVFTEIDVVGHLQTAAKKGSKLTACHCCKALCSISAPLPAYQSWNILRWKWDQVEAWATDIGLEDFAPAFSWHMVNGTVLLDMCIEDLVEIGLKSRVQGKWVMEQILKLRRRADVSYLDRENFSQFLTGIHRDLSVYRVDFARRGITASFLPHLTNEMLLEIGVHSAIDRMRILRWISETCDIELPDSDSTNALVPLSPRYRKRYDVFISYRRESGSQLASLLKVYLEIRNLSTFLDVTSLGGGKFDDALLTTIRQCSNLVVILTRDCLQRCIEDQRIEDWLHRELVCALERKVNIVPLCDPNFDWPDKQLLPPDLHMICHMNAVTWSHEYQEASVERLIKFLKLPALVRRQSMRRDVN